MIFFATPRDGSYRLLGFLLLPTRSNLGGQFYLTMGGQFKCTIYIRGCGYFQQEALGLCLGRFATLGLRNLFGSLDLLL